MPKSPVFIVGSPRSGTSALVLALETAGYHGYKEGNFLPLMKIIDRTIDNHFAQNGKANPNVLTAKIDRARLKDRIERIFIEMEEQAHPFPLWLDKSGHVEMINAIPTLRRFWPQSVYIFCKRRAIENVASRVKKFPGLDFERHCAGWANFMTAWRSARATLPADVFVEVDQQDLLREPEAICAKIATLLQLDPQQQSTLTNTIKQRRPQETTKGSAAQLHSLESIGWSQSQLAIFERYCAPEMDAYGYGSGPEYYARQSGASSPL